MLERIREELGSCGSGEADGGEEEGPPVSKVCEQRIALMRQYREAERESRLRQEAAIKGNNNLCRK